MFPLLIGQNGVRVYYEAAESRISKTLLNAAEVNAYKDTVSLTIQLMSDSWRIAKSDENAGRTSGSSEVICRKRSRRPLECSGPCGEHHLAKTQLNLNMKLNLQLLSVISQGNQQKYIQIRI